MKTLQWHLCPRTGYRKPLLGCVRCGRYPCAGVTPDQQRLLEQSPFTAISPQSKLVARKAAMYLFRMNSGEIKEANADFDPDRPDFEQLADVEEVLYVSKILVKQLRLVVKPKEERDAIKRNLAAVEEDIPPVTMTSEEAPVQEKAVQEKPAKARRGK